VCLPRIHGIVKNGYFPTVIPAQAEIWTRPAKNNKRIVHSKFETVDSRLRGNDSRRVAIFIMPEIPGRHTIL
jgi:hypothetical protein